MWTKLVSIDNLTDMSLQQKFESIWKRLYARDLPIQEEDREYCRELYAEIKKRGYYPMLNPEGVIYKREE